MSKTGLIGVVGVVLLVIALGLSYWFSQDPAPELAATPPEPTQEPTQEPAQEQPSTRQVEEQTQQETDTGSVSNPDQNAALGSNESPADTDASDQATAPQVILREGNGSDPNAPSFDVVRISPEGDSVFAGKAPPGSKVTIFSGDEVLGEVEADGRGEWVFLPEKPLAPGSHELSLTAEPVQVAAESSGDAQTSVAAAPTPEAPAPEAPSQKAPEPAPQEASSPAPESTDSLAVQSDEVVVLVVPEQGKDIGGTPSREPVQPLAVLAPRDGDGASRVLQKPVVTPGGVEAETGGLALDSIDYDQDGNLALRGRANPNALIRIYLDNALIGEAQAAASGEWLLQPQNPVAPGVYELRADQIEEAVVTSRLTLPFSRAEPIITAGDEQLIVVQPGNSLWRIARRTLGDGLAFTVIYEANKSQIGDPDLIYPGQIFAVPTNSSN